MTPKPRPPKTMLAPKDSAVRDAHRSGFTLLYTDGEYVALHHQPFEKAGVAMLRIPKTDFDNLIAWYVKPQRVRK